MNQIIQSPQNSLDRIDQNAAAMYLVGLSESGRYTMKHTLDLVAGMMTGEANALVFAWQELRF